MSPGWTLFLLVVIALVYFRRHIKLLCLVLKIAWLKWQYAKKMREGMAEIESGNISKETKVSWATKEIDGVRKCGDHRSVTECLRKISEAMESGATYEEMGTTESEVRDMKDGVPQKERAKQLLADARTDAKYTFGVVDLAEKAGFTLEEIGTTKEELFEIDRSYTLKLAKSRLEEFRDMGSKVHNDSFNSVEQGRESILGYINDSEGEEKYGFTLEELGTSQDELDEIVRESNFAKAKRELEILKQYSSEGSIGLFQGDVTARVTEPASKSGKTLADLGTSIEEIGELKRLCYFNAARNDLQRIQEKNAKDLLMFSRGGEDLPGDPHAILQRLRDNLEEANESLSKLDITEEELLDIANEAGVVVAVHLLERLRIVADQPRITEGQKIAAMLAAAGGDRRIIISSPEQKAELNQLEDQYPYDKDMSAIRLYLGRAKKRLEDIGSSESEMSELAQKFEAR